jgi:hypothetical protein
VAGFYLVGRGLLAAFDAFGRAVGWLIVAMILVVILWCVCCGLMRLWARGASSPARPASSKRRRRVRESVVQRDASEGIAQIEAFLAARARSPGDGGEPE